MSSKKITGIIHKRVGLAVFRTCSVITLIMKLQPFDKKNEEPSNEL
jgi:hypothetical protein